MRPNDVNSLTRSGSIIIAAPTTNALPPNNFKISTYLVLKLWVQMSFDSTNDHGGYDSGADQPGADQDCRQSQNSEKQW